MSDNDYATGLINLPQELLDRIERYNKLNEVAPSIRATVQCTPAYYVNGRRHIGRCVRKPIEVSKVCQEALKKELDARKQEAAGKMRWLLECKLYHSGLPHQRLLIYEDFALANKELWELFPEWLAELEAMIKNVNSKIEEGQNK